MDKIKKIAINLKKAEKEYDFTKDTATQNDVSINTSKALVDIEKGLRYNEGKLRYDLLEPYAIQELVKVFTAGSKKYEPNNWLKGMSWTSVLASLKRHVAAFEMGEDIDEIDTLHMANVAWNALALVSYYRYHPEYDDRYTTNRKLPKIGCDLDDCIISWVKPWCEKFGHNTPTDWYFSYDTRKHFENLKGEELDNFYANLPTKVNPSDIPFDISCYITARTISEDITKNWIEKNGFPTKPVYTVGFGKSKVDAAKEAGIDWFIDDNYETYLELNKAGITCFLMTADHNKKYDVGYKRISSFQDLKKRFL